MQAEDQGPDEELLELIRRTTPADEGHETRRELGRGGMGAVIEVWEKSLRRPLAKKVIRARSAERSASQVARFLEEAQVTAQLSHPGIPPVHALGIDAEDRPYFTMPVVRGHDLEAVYSMVRRSAEGWTLERALGVLLRVCETMAYAHSRGVIHRDLKPANVMVGEFGEVYVMDWGLARVLARASGDPVSRPRTDQSEAVVSSLRSGLDADSSLHTIEGAAVGTPSYMSPEQARGEALDSRSDVYAVGAMLYALLAGRAPHAPRHGAAPAAVVLSALRDGPPEPIASLAPTAPPELLAICSKAMERDPAGRYPDMRAMAADLRAHLEGRVVVAHRTGPWIEFRKWIRRNKATAGALGGLVLVALAGAGILAWRESAARAVEQDRNQRILSLADTKLDQELRAGEGRLWPAHPDKTGELDAWLVQAKKLLERLPEHEQSRRLFAANFGSVRDVENAWLLEQVEALIKSLETLPELVAEVATRAETARNMTAASVDGAEARAAWADARAQVASSSLYGGLDLPAQLGLLPLGADPRSGLWEFWVVASGARPERDATSGRWRILEETGIVLVLLPGTGVTVGARPVDMPAGAKSWEQAYELLEQANPEPFADIRPQTDEVLWQDTPLDPWFISKYELTQAQYQRVMRSNPSELRDAERKGGPTHPVEKISWHDARLALQRLGLELPTEVQFEHAMRGGTSTPFAHGHRLTELHRHANVRDAVWLKAQGGKAEGLVLSESDGFEGHAPVGSLEPNGYGLHDMSGNVIEWCLDAEAIDPQARPRAGDGLRNGDMQAGEGVIRGGSWYGNPLNARASNRMNLDRKNTDQDLGARAVRRLQR